MNGHHLVSFEEQNSAYSRLRPHPMVPWTGSSGGAMTSRTRRPSAKTSISTLRGKVLAEVERRRGEILGISEDLYRHPELSGREERSCQVLAALLRRQGFRVRVGLAGLPTAFHATIGEGKDRPRVAFLAEYDALPGMGHGCGHNLIAAASIGASLALLPILDRSGGGIEVIGTPAEETIGGKVPLVEAGCFDGLDAAMMIHPAGENRVYTTSLAAATYRIEYQGRAAHAVVHPEKGINALDALIDLYRMAPTLVQEIGDGGHLPGVIREGGERANVVPDRAVGEFSLRARSLQGLTRLEEKFFTAAREIAAARGCRLSIGKMGHTYREMRTNGRMAEKFKENLRFFGVTTEDKPRTRMGSLDMGNVSQKIPSIHPFIAICEPGLASHTAEFGRATISERGQEGLLLATRALALTAVDLLTDPSLVGEIRVEFERSRPGASPR